MSFRAGEEVCASAIACFPPKNAREPGSLLFNSFCSVSLVWASLFSL